MNNDEIRDEMNFITLALRDMKNISVDSDLERFAEMLEHRFEYLKDETLLSLDILENRLKAKNYLRVVK